MPRSHKQRDHPWPKPKIGPHRGSCGTGKVCYETRREANQAVNAMTTAASKRAYRCDVCGYFHLTSQREGAYRTARAARLAPPEAPA